MRPTSANKRRRRNVAAEARRAPVRLSTAWTPPIRTGLAGASATGDAGANASGPLIGAVIGALTPRAHTGCGARRIAMRLRRPVARSVVKIGAMVAPPWGRVSAMLRRCSWSQCWRAGTEWIKSRGCDTRLRSVFPVTLSDHRGNGLRAECGFGRPRLSNARSDSPLHHERPFVVKQVPNECLPRTSARVIVRSMSGAGHPHSPSRYACRTGRPARSAGPGGQEHE